MPINEYLDIRSHAVNKMYKNIEILRRNLTPVVCLIASVTSKSVFRVTHAMGQQL